ncbi:MAG: ArsB/NhaD family transporter [Thermaceae bacterium]|nr:ArsB/NhaD family transporter [Thermaceae bacterium]
MEQGEAIGLLGLLGYKGPPEGLAGWALAVFAGTYVLIFLERYLHRTMAALLGASTVLVLGILTPQEAWRSIDYGTMFLLFGMMLMVAIMAKSGFFALMADHALRYTEGSPKRILWVFSLLTAFFSAFLDNVTTVLFMAPVVLHLCLRLKIPPVPFLVAVVLASNLGGTATLIGDPPNIIIGSIGGKSFNDFLVNVAPYVALAFLAGIGAMQLLLARQGLLDQRVSREAVRALLEEPGRLEVDWPLLRKSVGVFALTVLLFVLSHGVLHLESGVIALFMASLLALISRTSPVWFLERVEWVTLIFFAGLFIVVGGLEHTGVFHALAVWLRELMGTNLKLGVLIVGVGSALISGFVDNIPYTISMSYVLRDLRQTLGPSMDPLWWALSIGACLGGNLTLIGASANVVTADIAARAGHPISFLTFLRYGTPISAVTVGVALLLFYVLHP